MKGFFTQEQVSVAQGKDLVQWILGDRKIRIYYPTAIKLAGKIRVSAKCAVELAGDNPRLWRELAKYENLPPTVRLNRQYRRSGHLSNLRFEPLVEVQGELVAVQLDDLVAKFHCVHALMVQAALHRAAINAKRWAGDGSRGLILSALLTNATPEGPLLRAGGMR